MKELSGGEKKKLRLLKILTKCPQLILLDEPEVALDIKSKETLLEWLKKHKSNSIVIIITHNPELTNFADYIINLS
ncbi:AAA family ATPase [Fusibacter sp. JL298sf-3]